MNLRPKKKNVLYSINNLIQYNIIIYTDYNIIDVDGIYDGCEKEVEKLRQTISQDNSNYDKK